MLSVAGFPEDSVFDQLSSWANFVFRESLVAEIYRAGAEIMTQPVFVDKAKEILEATKQAGRELVESMKVSSETMARIKQAISEDKEHLEQDGQSLLENLHCGGCNTQGIR